MANNLKLQKVYLEFEDAESGLIMQYQQENTEGESLQSVDLPIDPDKLPPGHIRMDIYNKDERNPAQVEGLSKIQYIVLGDGGTPNADLQDWKRSNRILDAIQPNDFEPTAGKIFPTLRFRDVTERDMFGEQPIEAMQLSSNRGGIWAWHGLRKFEIEINGLELDEEAADFDHRVSLYWYKRDNDTIQPIFEKEIRYNLKNKKYIAYINTNALGDALERAESSNPRFSGRFEVHLSWQRYKKVYSFPLELCVNNTKLADDEEENHVISTNGYVSIDFGTSSTCAAIQGKQQKELITLSGVERLGEDGKDNPFENPTNLMIYTWSEFYNQWKRDNPDCPFLVAKSDRIDDVQADYDSGYTVDDVLKEVVGGGGDLRGRLKMMAIITQIKMIPTMLRNKFELKLHPLNDVERPIVMLTDEVNEEDYRHLNPIAFYGYLLSRAINNPAKGTCYTNYLISFPVKFDKSERESIRKSLEYGILRALPYYVRTKKNAYGEPLVNIEMNFEESVACIGAIAGNQLQITEESPEPKLFAVFDLGGGTLDISYGMFRNATDEEIDESGGEQTIQIFGVSGNDMVGGEKLIHQIAYKIYLDNRDVTETNKIVFELPLGELQPEGFDDLLRRDEISAANLSTMKEKIARKIFMYDGEKIVEDAFPDILDPENQPSMGRFKIELRDKYNQIVDLELTVSDIEIFLENKIRKVLEDFKVELKDTFGAEKNQKAMLQAGLRNFSLNDVAIFLGGNASKQRFVMKNLRELFPNNKKIEFIGEGQNPEGVNAKYLVTSKTAVAFGQLILANDYNVDRPFVEEESPFPYNVGYIRGGDRVFVKVIEKMETGNEWKPANSIVGRTTGNISLHYTESPQAENLLHITKAISMRGAAGRQLWIRIAPNHHKCIEYRLGTRNSKFSADDPVDENCIIELKDRTIHQA